MSVCGIRISSPKWKYKKQFSPQWVLQAQGKYNYSKNKYQDEGAQYEGGITTEHYRQNEYYLSATLSTHPLKSFRWL
jgi:hypothetical protein